MVIRNTHFGSEKFMNIAWDNIEFIDCDFASGYTLDLDAMSRCRFEGCRFAGIIGFGVMRDVYFLRSKAGGRSIIGGSPGSVNVTCEECEFIGDSPDPNHRGSFGSNGDLTLIRCKARNWEFPAYTLLHMVKCEMQNIALKADDAKNARLTVDLQDSKFYSLFDFYGAPLHTFTMRNCSFDHIDLTNTSIQGDMVIEKASGGYLEFIAGNSNNNSLTIRNSMFSGAKRSRFSASSFRNVLVDNCVFSSEAEYSATFGGGYAGESKPADYDIDTFIFRGVRAKTFGAIGHNTREMRSEKCQFDTLKLADSRFGKLAIYDTQIGRTLDLAKVQAAEFKTNLPPVSRLGGRVDVLDGSNIKPIGGKR
ncbi:MAG: hypothetical protein LBQ25_01020 [Azonexus sp.]|nr:hypothetical protein [Azonexus sp.]